jgi:hypothetical protein
MTHLTYNNLSQLDLQQFEYFQEELAKRIWYDFNRLLRVDFVNRKRLFLSSVLVQHFFVLVLTMKNLLKIKHFVKYIALLAYS